MRRGGRTNEVSKDDVLRGTVMSLYGLQRWNPGNVNDKEDEVGEEGFYTF